MGSTFRKRHRKLPMTHNIAFQFTSGAKRGYEVRPVPRGVAIWLDYVAEQNAPAILLSCVRAHRVLAPFNKRHGTHGQSQEQLVAAHRRDPANNAPANPPHLTSHCWFSDGNPVYRTPDGKRIPAGGTIPWYQIGIDLVDLGKSNDASAIVRRSCQLGVKMVLPYPAGSERHHAVLAESPVPQLLALNLISENRS